jgi:hypothetical protein
LQLNALPVELIRLAGESVLRGEQLLLEGGEVLLLELLEFLLQLFLLRLKLGVLHLGLLKVSLCLDYLLLKLS